jgi:hypothetical protein
MANYFPVALTKIARSWLMNLSEDPRLLVRAVPPVYSQL